MKKNINEREIKPTFSEPKSKQASEYQDNFDKQMLMRGVNLNEIDGLLNEKEQSLKKKIFSLAKMEALVFSDPKLTAVYDEMAENGEEKYGYHYNETIMNIIFNEYVLNDAKYLQKYKQAIPKEKKRRDKSGINALKKNAEELEKKRQDYQDRMSGKAKENLYETNSGGSGAFHSPLSYKDDVKNVSREIDTEKEKKTLEKVEVALPGREKHAYDKYTPAGKNVSSAVARPEVNQEVKKPFYNGGKITAPILNDVNINTLKPPKKNDTLPQDKLNENMEQNTELPEDQIEETTSAGAGATGSGGAADYTYVGPAAWGGGDLMNGKKTKKDKESFWKGGKVIQESEYLTDPSGFEKYLDLLTEENDVDYIRKNSEAYGSLDNMNKNDVSIIKNDIKSGTVDEHHAKTREEKMDVVLQYLNSQDDGTVVRREDLQNMSDVALDQTYNDVERLMGIAEEQLSEKSESKSQQRFMGMVHAVQKGELSPSEVGPDVNKAAKSMSYKDAEDFASTKHKGLPEKVDENPALMAMGTAAAGGFGQAMGDRVADNIGLEETMIDNQEDSMKMKPPIGTDSMGDFPRGMQVASMGGMNENTKKTQNIMKEAEKLLEQANKELNLIDMHHKKLQEDRKPSTLVMKDRLGDENDKNFKKDLKHSGTKEIIDTTKELEWKDQQTDVPKDPQKLGKDLEKQALKNTGGESFKNVGNSTNNKGDEIPKRNLSDDEANEVDLYRKGLSDVVFDNEPDERFEERMKRDMGDKIYKERQQTMELEAEAPMYNKDTQPMENGIEKDQFDKNKTKWNDRLGINEGVVTGKYVNKLGKNSFVDFNLKNVTEVSEINEGYVQLNLNGLGNTYSSKVELNESVAKVINDWNFYLFEDKIFVHKPVQNLNESEQKGNKRPVNEQFDKMKHLLGYKPSEFIDSKRSKL